MDEGERKVNWLLLPESITLEIFSFLHASNMYVVCQVCRMWNRISGDDFLWRRFFRLDFGVDKSIPIANGVNKLWKNEYRRLVDELPVVESEVLDEHGNQVLHVAFSHNGQWFSTCSKDGYVHVWTTTYPSEVHFYRDMKKHSWKCTQFSQFNCSDTLLLVSGIYFGDARCTSGEIAVFNLEQEFRLQCRVQNKPYDLFGTWYNENYLLSGDLHWLGRMGSATFIWLNKSKQEISSEHEAIINRLYKFYNVNASSVRTIMVSKCISSNYNQQTDMENQDIQEAQVTDHNNLHQDTKDSRSPIVYSKDYRLAENITEQPELKEDTFPPYVTLEEECDKYLIFTTGSDTYSPHQIGIKKIKKFNIPTKVTYDIDISERLQKLERLQEVRNAQALPGWEDPDAIFQNFDSIDHIIDMNGYVVGMGLSPDHRFLYVNTRAWPESLKKEDIQPLFPPPISEDIDLHVIDLTTLKKVGTMFKSHKAFTSNESCFFLFLDVSHEYVASGAENTHGYIWDRHYGICLARYPHTDVVNCVGFNPVDRHMLVTVGDDNLVKVWRSRKRARELNIDLNKVKIGKEFRKKSKSIEKCDLITTPIEHQQSQVH